MNRPSNQLSASVLRIGNWVMGNAPFQVDAMHIALAESREREGFEIGWQPIPLTEEWLERFGFVSDNDGVHFLHRNESLVYDIRDDMIAINGEWLHYGIFKYVHQLQNLYFALTGEELTIKTN